MDVEVKGTKKKVIKKTKKGTPVRDESQDEDDKPVLTKVEAKRGKPDGYLMSQIRKMSKEQRETAVAFMESRNEARVRAGMEPAYSESDMELYK